MAANDNQGPLTTIVPFADRQKLPQCAVSCKALYDANANCVPPAIPSGPTSGYESCFCLRPAVMAMSTATDQVCNDVCGGQEGGDASVASWFRSLCHVTADAGGNDGGKNTNTNNGKNTNAGTKTKGSGGDQTITTSDGNNSSNNPNWISNHWQWVIFLVVMIVAIVGIWIGACIWRRRYLRRKEGHSSLRQKQSGSVNRPSWGPGPTPMPNSESGAPMTYASNTEAALPKFASSEKPKQKKKWTVTSRT